MACYWLCSVAATPLPPHEEQQKKHMTAITTTDKKRFEAIRKDLSLLGCRESSFLKVELLFFEALSISRHYGEDPGQNPLLAQLKQLQGDAYEKTRAVTAKSRQREQHIRKFIVQLKKALSGK